MKKVCVVTGSRAEYGLLKKLIEKIQLSPHLELQLIVTGSHLESFFGETYKEILADGHVIDHKVKIDLQSDASSGIANSLALGVKGIADALENLKPDILLILGDRFEIFAAASAALVSRVPIAHLHGGEVTEGAYDDALRHSITKMSHLHFVATEEFKLRVIQMGEDENNVHMVGGLGVDSVEGIDFLTRAEIEKSLNLKFAKRNLLITFHPVTLEVGQAQYQVQELLSALDSIQNVNYIFTMPNSDNEGRHIFDMIQDFVSKNSGRSNAFQSLGQVKYFSCLKYVDGVVGNSSSGILEAPSFGIGTVNIGSRQKGRPCAQSVINCAPKKEDIVRAVNCLYSDDFKDKLKNIAIPYGKAGASDKIVKVLEDTDFKPLLRKIFSDLR